MTEEKTTATEQAAERASRVTEEMTEQTARFSEQMSRFPYFQPFSELNTAWWSGAQQLAAWYIDTSEKMAHGALEIQERAMDGAKDSPWAPLLESQRALARQWIEGSAHIARRLWRIEQEGEAQKRAKEESKRRERH